VAVKLKTLSRGYHLLACSSTERFNWKAAFDTLPDIASRFTGEIKSKILDLLVLVCNTLIRLNFSHKFTARPPFLNTPVV
jgi:hypothetical protein